MILTALALLVAQQGIRPPSTAPETEEGRAAACQASVRRSPQEALAIGNRWQAAGGGLLARQCQGLAYTALEQWTTAATIYEQAAQEAARAGDARTPDLWVQAGNAWIAGGEMVRARQAFDTALAAPDVTPVLRGEIYLDRARARVAQQDLAGARVDLDQALQLVAADPMAWYLSAELARRQNEIARARTDIARARTLAADSPDILLLAGTIAGQAGDMTEAERIYRQVVAQAPNTDAGRSAAASLATIREVPAPPAAAPTQPPR